MFFVFTNVIKKILSYPSSDLYSLQGSPGKRGVSGDRGAKGQRGDPVSAGASWTVS